ncbi:MAG: DUF983 domain-containing protein [Verrucomicrobiota bacterium]
MGIFRHWFRLHPECPHCQLPLEKEESGFYFGTTSIGYVLAIILVILPVCILAVLDIIAVWTAVLIGMLGSIALCAMLYPFLICWVIAVYYLLQPGELPANQSEESESND